jgi:hypothetical protein
MLPIHITVAILSLVSAGILYFSPTKTKLYATYVTTALMLLSGFYLVLSKPASMTHACISGLTSLAIISYVIVKVRTQLRT